MTSGELLAPVSETEQLRQQLLQAQRLSSVGALASSVAHEFNNILTTIINYARLGLRGKTIRWLGAGVREDPEGRPTCGHHRQRHARICAIIRPCGSRPT